ncbi:MAG TPA: non-canonical purine NTP pyrophosphatase [Longimicrobiales bacterium]|nr:non-canonical purine NTP pyrophosphatase [Longimicrobiales bacterium]
MPSSSDPAILIATRSGDKAREIRQILESALGSRLLSLHDASVEPDPAEDGVECFPTFLANAHAKAAFFMQRTGMPTLADDSGICVHALGGAPGVHSRRYAAKPGLDGLDLDRANNELLLRELQHTPLPRRTAHYTCAAVLHLADGRRFSAVGTCSGAILTEPRGNNGFGYDPLFIDPATGISFAEMDPAAKNRKSHRARAFRALAATLPKLPGY